MNMRLLVVACFVLYSVLSHAQQRKIPPIDIDEVIQKKKYYNKSVVCHRTYTLDILDNDFITILQPQKLSKSDQNCFHGLTLVTDTIILITSRIDSVRRLIDTKYESLMYDDEYYSEKKISYCENANEITIFTDIYKTIRIFFIRSGELSYCLID